MNLPPSLDIPTLADWLYAAGLGDAADQNVPSETRQARAVRALLSAKIREALQEYEEPVVGGEWTAESIAHYANLAEREAARVVDAVLGSDT